MKQQRQGIIQMPSVLQVIASWLVPSGPRHPFVSIAEIVTIVGFVVGGVALAVTRDWHAARDAGSMAGGAVAVALVLGWFWRRLLRGGFGKSL